MAAINPEIVEANLAGIVPDETFVRLASLADQHEHGQIPLAAYNLQESLVLRRALEHHTDENLRDQNARRVTVQLDAAGRTHRIEATPRNISAQVTTRLPRVA